MSRISPYRSAGRIMVVAVCLAAVVALGSVRRAPDSFGAAARIASWDNFTDVRDVTALTEHRDTLWVATTGGLVYLPIGDPGAETRLTNADGLGENSLQFVAVDAAGAVWTGGPRGRLSRRLRDDDWDVFPIEDENRLPVDLLAATAGPDGFLWVGSRQGVHKFDTQRHGGELKETYSKIGDWPDNSPVRDLVVVRDTIWLAGDAGLARAAVGDPSLAVPNRWETWEGLGKIRAVASYRGAVFAGGENGLYYFRETWGTMPPDYAWFYIETEFTDVRDLCVSGDTLWVTTASGVGACKSIACDVTQIPGAVGTGFTSVACGGDGSVWIGQTNHGVWSRAGGEWTAYSFDGPPANLAIDVAVGSDGKVWCVFPNDGAAFFKNGTWTELPYYKVGSSSPGEAVAVSSNGDVWLGAFGAGAFWVNPAAPLDDSGWTRFDSSNSTLMWHTNVDNSPNNFILVTDVAVDPSGRAWFANTFADSGRAIAYHENGCWGYFDSADGLFLPELRAVLAATANSLLIGTLGSGVLELEYPEPLCEGVEPIPVQGTVTRKDMADGLPSDDVLSVLVDRLDSIFVGTNLGLAKWQPRLRRFVGVELPPEAGLTINALAADAGNGIWVGTTLGLAVLRPDGTEEFYNATNSGLVGDAVREIAIDEATGQVWIATESGLSRVAGPIPVAAEIELVVAYPNPVEIIANTVPRVAFNASTEGRVFIFTASGRPVVDFPVPEGWDCRNSGGRLVASGVYLFVVKSPDGSHGRGKIAVINRN